MLHVDRAELAVRSPAQPRVAELVVDDAQHVVAVSRDRCDRATSCGSRRGAGRSRSRAPRPHCSPNLTPMSSPPCRSRLRSRRRRVPAPHPRAHDRAGRRRVASSRTTSTTSWSRSRHDGERVVSCENASHRWPWSTCPDAAVPLRQARGHAALAPLHRGRPLDRPEAELHAPVRHRVPRDHARRRGVATRASTTSRSRAATRDRRDATCGSGSTASSRSRGRSTGTASSIPQPPFDAAPWRGGFMRWADATLPEDDAECAIALRRACDIGMGRGMDLDGVPVADQLPQTMAGICHTMQPGVGRGRVPHVGSIRDFSPRPGSAAARLTDDAAGHRDGRLRDPRPVGSAVGARAVPLRSRRRRRRHACAASRPRRATRPNSSPASTRSATRCRASRRHLALFHDRDVEDLDAFLDELRRRLRAAAATPRACSACGARTVSIARSPSARRDATSWSAARARAAMCWFDAGFTMSFGPLTPAATTVSAGSPAASARTPQQPGRLDAYAASVARRIVGRRVGRSTTAPRSTSSTARSQRVDRGVRRRARVHSVDRRRRARARLRTHADV